MSKSARCAERFGVVVNIDIGDLVPHWSPFEPPKRPAGSPNLLHIVLDDVQLSAMSWDPVATANIDRMSRPDGGRCSRELEVEIARRRHLECRPIRRREVPTGSVISRVAQRASPECHGNHRLCASVPLGERRLGRGMYPDSIAEVATELEVDHHVVEPGDDFGTVLAAALDRGADLLMAAGGDGTLCAIANVAMDHDLPMVVVPAGTRNHFALDVGLDLEDRAACCGTA